MTKQFDDCAAYLEREAARLCLPFDAENFKRDITVWLPHRTRTSTAIRSDAWQTWAHSVTITLFFTADVSEPTLSCRAEVSWSSTGRSVSMALAAVKLYELAIEFAALAECVMSGVSVPEVQP